MNVFILTECDKKISRIRGQAALLGHVVKLDVNARLKCPAVYVRAFDGRTLELVNESFMVDWIPEYKRIGYLRRDVSAGFSPQLDVAAVDAVFLERSETCSIHRVRLRLVEATPPLPIDAWIPAHFSKSSYGHHGWLRGADENVTAVIVGAQPTPGEPLVIEPVYGSDLSAKAVVESVESWQH